MTVLVTGSSGLVGSALVAALRAEGQRVIRLVRGDPGSTPDAARWDPASGAISPARAARVDAVVHLAGENVAGGRWSGARKARIRDSRIGPTRALAESLARLDSRPDVLVSASGIGFYGDRGAELLTEDSGPGQGFLPDVCGAWEAATEPAAAAGIRVVSLRIGMVLSVTGGALRAMLTPFRLGLGGVVGTGRQYVSWITLDDLVDVIRHALREPALRGPVNAVAPHPVTNAELTRVLGHVLARPTVLAIPAFALRLLLGEMADALLLASARVIPARLQSSHHAWRHPDLDGALRHVLAPPGPRPA